MYQYFQGTTCGCKGLFHKDKDNSFIGNYPFYSYLMASIGSKSAAFSRIPSEEDPCNCTYCEGEEYAPRLDIDRPMRYTLDNPTGSAADNHSDDTSRDTNHDGFDEELT